MSTNFEYNSFARTIDGTNFCSGMETNAENVIEDNESDATIVYPGRNEWITPRSSSYVFNDRTCEIILPNKIYKLKHLYLKPTGTKLYNKVYANFIDENGNNFTEDILELVFNVSEWNALYTAPSDTAYSYINGTYKDNTFFWENESNIIQIISTTYKKTGISQPIFGDDSPVYERLLRTMFKRYGNKYVHTGTGEKLSSDNILKSTITTDPRKWEFIVEYIPVTSKTKLRARKSAKTIRDYFQPFNQRAEVNSAGAFGKSMYLSAQKTGVEEMTIVKNVKSLSEILPLGCRVKHDNKYYILTGRKIELTNTVYAKVTYTLSQNWSNRSKHVSVDQKYRNYNIPNDIVWRNLYFEDFVDITAYSDKTNMNTAISEIKGKIKDKYYYGIKKGSIQYGIDVLSQIFYCDTTKDRTINHFAFYNGSDNKEGAILPCTTMGLANSLVFNASMKDNLSAGLRMNPNDSTFCEETYYCNEDGTLTDNTAYIKLSCGINNFNASKYPASRTNAGSDSYNEPYSMIFNEIFHIDKDPGEALKFTYQVHFVSDDPDIIIGNAIAEKHPLVKKYAQDTPFTSRPLIYVLLKDKIRQGEEKIQIESDDKEVKIITETEKESYFLVETQKENGIYYGFKLTVNSNANDIATYSAWAILDDEKNILVACNDMTKKYLYFSHIHGRNQ